MYANNFSWILVFATWIESCTLFVLLAVVDYLNGPKRGMIEYLNFLNVINLSIFTLICIFMLLLIIISEFRQNRIRIGIIIYLVITLMLVIIAINIIDEDHHEAEPANINDYLVVYGIGIWSFTTALYIPYLMYQSY